MEKIYTQEDMDNITSKVKETMKSKYEKTHIDLETFKNLENKYNELLSQNKIANFKEVFIKNGGNPNAYQDFISANKSILDIDNEKELNKEFENLKQSKAFYFEDKNITSISPRLPQDDEIVKDLLGENNDDLVNGTIYKNNFLK